MARELKDIVGEIGDKYAAEQREVFFEQFDNAGYEVSDWSPIEAMMAYGILFALKSREHFDAEGGLNEFVPSYYLKTFEETDFSWQDRHYGVLVYPQMKVGKYRADFVVNMKSDRRKQVFGIIECDGHDYHEKTKQQAQHDKARDRYFQSLGFYVLRYTGSEIYRDPVKCAIDALHLLYGHANKRSGEER